jgi:hypothetical protein
MPWARIAEEQIMGASVVAYWPGITEDQIEAQTGLYNGPGRWASWTLTRESAPNVLLAMRDLGVDAVCTLTTDGLDDAQVSWVSPEALKAAALRLRDLVLSRAQEVEAIVHSYAAAHNDNQTAASEMFAQDLADVAGMADFAAREGIQCMTLSINW